MKTTIESNQSVKIGPTLMIALSDKLKADLIATLESKIHFQVFKILTDVTILFELLETDQPDYLLIDNELPNIGGFGFLKKLNRLKSKTKVIVYGSSSNPHYLKAFLSCPGIGFIEKSCGIEDFISCLQKIFSGKRIIFTDVQDIQNDRATKEMLLQDRLFFKMSKLSDREIQVWELLVKAKTEKEIAETLSISTSTVRTHKNKISEKMNIKGKQRLSSFAIKNT